MAKKLMFDRALFIAVVLLLVAGLVMVYSSSAVFEPGDFGFKYSRSLLVKQTAAAILGVMVMGIAMMIDYRTFRSPWVIYAGVVGALSLLVAALFAGSLNGSSRWVSVAGVSLQPSEVAKLALVFFLASHIERKRDRINESSFLIPSLGATGLMAFLIYLEPDYATMALILLIGGLMIFLAGLAWKSVVVAGVVGVAGLAFLALSASYRRARILAFLQPEADPQGGGFQIIQSKLAVGSGGVFGMGLGQSGQKLHFLPAASSDYIFAILSEELGLIGALLLLSLFVLLAWRGVLAGWRAPDEFGRFVAWGITAMLVGQALVHVSVTLQLFPPTGVTLPYISAGGSSLVTTLLASGVLLNVSQHA